MSFHKKLALLGLVAFASFPAGAEDAKACSVTQNEVRINYYSRTYSGHNYKTWCKSINNDITIFVTDQLRDQSIHINKATVKTKGEAGTCSLYLITRVLNDYHFRFEIGDWETKSTTTRTSSYSGFRLGC